MKTLTPPGRLSRWFWPLIACLLWGFVVVKESYAGTRYLVVEQFGSMNRTGPFSSAVAASTATLANFSIYYSETFSDCGTNFSSLVNHGDSTGIAANSATYPGCASIGSVGLIIRLTCTDPDVPIWVSGSSSCGADPAPCSGLTGTGTGNQIWQTTPPPLSMVCLGSCQVDVNGFSRGSKWAKSGDWSGNYTGSSCAGGDPTVNTTPSACAAGTCTGNVNGVDVCVPCTNTTAGTTSTTHTPPPDGTPSTPGAPAEGSKTTQVESEVTRNGSQVTTKTTTSETTYGPGGVGTTVVTIKEEEKGEGTEMDEFCVRNPNSPLCKVSSFGGTCSAFTCDGDAIQCAMAREQHRRNCTLFDTATDLSDLGNDAAAGTDSGTTDNPANEDNREEVDIGSSLDQTRWLTGACPAPVVTTIAGTGFTLDFEPVCNVLEVIGLLGIAVTLVIAVRIVGVF